MELDADGIPWDTRIHADSKAKIADGTWRKRRKLDPEYLASVMAELKACSNPEPTVGDTPTTVNHSELLQKMVDDFASGALNIFTVSNTLLELGLSNLKEAEGNPELIQEIASKLGVS